MTNQYWQQLMFISVQLYMHLCLRNTSFVNFCHILERFLLDMLNKEF